MALDFAILDSDGKPSQSVPLGDDAHWELIAIGKTKRVQVVHAFADYYSDAVLETDKIGPARSELRQLRDVPVSTELRNALRNLDTLFGVAIDAGKPIHIIAD